MPRGNKSKYDSHVKPYLDDVTEWANIMTERQMAKKLGIAYSTWCAYKNDHMELSEALKKGRQNLCADLKSVLIERAKGFQYTDRKIIKENGEVKREEVYVKSALPDVASIQILLKNYDENWADNPQVLELKKKELEIRERQVESKEWQ